MKESLVIFLLFILSGGVFITSERFMNIENDAKSYFIGVTVVLLLIVCSITRKGLFELGRTLRSSGICIGFSAVCLILSVYGLLQYVGFIPSRHYAFPITGTYENPAGFAAVQAALFPFALSLCLDAGRKSLVRCSAAITSIACVLTVILSGSRAGMLAVCAAGIVMTAFRTRVLRIFKSHSWLWIPLIVAAAVSLLSLYRIKTGSADGRLFVWRVCWDLIKERPLFGYGTGGFQKHYMDAQAAYFSQHSDSPFIMLADNVTHPFNEYVYLTVNFGLAGLAVALYLLVLTVKRLLISDDSVKVKGLAVVTSLSVMCLFSYPFHYAAVWFTAATAVIPAFLKQGLDSISSVTPGYLRVTFPVLLTLLLAAALRMMYLDLKWAEMSRRSLAGHTERMLRYYERMKPQMRHNPLFLYNYAAELNYIDRYEESLTITEECMKGWNDYDVQILFADNLENTGQIDRAIEAYLHASNMIPCRFEPLESLMNLYIETGDTLNAVNTARKILSKPIKVPSARVAAITDNAKVLIEKVEIQ